MIQAADDGATPRISVVIPVLDAAEWLGHQPAALAAQDVPVPWEVLVADNGSTDETVDVALSWRKDLPLRLVDASERRGINHARTAGPPKPAASCCSTATATTRCTPAGWPPTGAHGTPGTWPAGWSRPPR